MQHIVLTVLINSTIRSALFYGLKNNCFNQFWKLMPWHTIAITQIHPDPYLHSNHYDITFSVNAKMNSISKFAPYFSLNFSKGD